MFCLHAASTLLSRPTNHPQKRRDRHRSLQKEQQKLNNEVHDLAFQPMASDLHVFKKFIGPNDEEACSSQRSSNETCHSPVTLPQISDIASHGSSALMSISEDLPSITPEFGASSSTNECPFNEATLLSSELSMFCPTSSRDFPFLSNVPNQKTAADLPKDLNSDTDTKNSKRLQSDHMNSYGNVDLKESVNDHDAFEQSGDSRSYEMPRRIKLDELDAGDASRDKVFSVDSPGLDDGVGELFPTETSRLSESDNTNYLPSGLTSLSDLGYVALDGEDILEAEEQTIDSTADSRREPGLSSLNDLGYFEQVSETEGDVQKETVSQFSGHESVPLYFTAGDDYEESSELDEDQGETCTVTSLI